MLRILYRTVVAAPGHPRGYRQADYKLANAELLNPDFINVYYPAKYFQMEHAKAEAANDKPLYVAKCRFCRICFMTEEELAAHHRDTRPCPHQCGLCSAGGDIHRCSVYGNRIEEDRAPARKYEEEKE